MSDISYISTRGEAAPRAFSAALMAGLAEDGGLFLPEQWPTLTADDLQRFAGQPYNTVAADIVSRFADQDFSEAKLADLVERAYASFDHACVAPLSQTGAQDWLLELYHGPTLAFKDVAMQLLGLLFEDALKTAGGQLTIVGATSGDTGAAAMEAFRNRACTNVFILFPQGRVSPFQQRQMTTIDAANTFALSVEGTFDDCQRIVKELFSDADFRDEVRLSGVNSINWARLVPQIVYFVTSSLAIGGQKRPVSYVVPTGNFGDIFAGYVAKLMGAPIGKLIIATNSNDILARCLETGTYKVLGVTPTTSPSMDIQVSSNFERLLFEASGRDPALIRGLMASLGQSGSFDLPGPMLSVIRQDFAALSATEPEVQAGIAQFDQSTKRLIDPHTSVGWVVAQKARNAGLVKADEPLVVLSTAHPAKFADAVVAATGKQPEVPDRMMDIQQREERLHALPGDAASVKAFVRSQISRG